ILTMKNRNTSNLDTLSSGIRRVNKTIKMLANNRINRAPSLPATWVNWFIGFLDGDGYLGHTKSGNNIKWELNFNLSSRDSLLLEEIRDKLGVGVVKPIVSAKKPTHRLSISSAEDIVEVIMPLIEPYTLYTRSRYWQFERARLLLEGAISKYAEMPIINIKAPVPYISVEKILSNPIKSLFC
uniref:LAGLIDADG endonuclease n=1 Tax=Spizellomyces sp. 'palustris' TaxID=117820 RepID=UPI0010FC0253